MLGYWPPKSPNTRREYLKRCKSLISTNGLCSVRVSVDEVLTNLVAETLDGLDILGLLGEDIEGVLDSVSGDNDRGVSLGVGSLELAIEEDLSGVCKTTLDVFAHDDSASVQATMYRLAELFLYFPEVHDVYYALPNRHHS
ncbi:hypothetical protein K493DRAFT_297102 [Basidiobolus meristosporus CBS 931.73]|uniref:factor independent urate hydroxylase n=1 Tax=Basidiobolus meristosporus CBS 931.73 TaxID=1314790 RepID=A0A1Y1Z209_9FUNG|nr:hypothetical protein K493DRAFT_297102 [Basidiobolus meristosporus CBS 931.73]|eukprot:ORY04249.1 hypothetical protein K493DRAFT_297102 [Basidiobolus meristosporus CBS 931.73]